MSKTTHSSNIYNRNFINWIKRSSGVTVDNNAAIRLAQNPEFHRRTKHIALKYYFIREKVSENEITIIQIPTGDQLADVMTKPLKCQIFKC